MRALTYLDKYFEEAILTISFVVTIFLVFMQVIFRYVIQSSLSWSEELVRYIFVWQIWLGAAYAAKLDKHINITVIRDKMNKKTQIIVEAFVLISWFAFSLFMTVKGIDVVKYILNVGQRTPALQIPMGYPYVSVPFGCGLMSLRVLQKMILSIPKWKEGWN